MTTADFAAFSNNAIMFASIVYMLAFLAHVLEWSLRGRGVRDPRPPRRDGRGPVAAGSGVERLAGATGDGTGVPTAASGAGAADPDGADQAATGSSGGAGSASR